MPSYTPYISKDFVIQGTFLRLDDKEKAWAEVDGRVRTAVRKAREYGIVVNKVANTKANVQKFESFCLNRDDIPANLTDRYHLYFGEDGGEVIAAILIVEVSDKLFMLCHASLPQAKKKHVPSLLIWRVVEDFAGSRFRVFDIGASYRASLQKFFSGWRTSPYPMIMKAPELKPALMLTPFDTASLGAPLPRDAERRGRAFIDALANGKPWTFFPRAMYAVFTIIKHLKVSGTLKEGQNIWVTTTTDTRYLSSCVRSAIEQTAPVSRKLTNDTGAIFVVHEFGFPHPALRELRRIADERNIPLIEDCAYALGTEGAGDVGDYVIFSLTKSFPVQFGGILVGKHLTHDELWKGFGCSDAGKEQYTLRMLSPWAASLAERAQRRRANLKWFAEAFGVDRLYFQPAQGVVPGACVLRCASEAHMAQTGEFARGFGIECRNYWRNAAIILPVHQRLMPAHLEYIAGAVLATEREWCGVPGARHG